MRVLAALVLASGMLLAQAALAQDAAVAPAAVTPPTVATVPDTTTPAIVETPPATPTPAPSVVTASPGTDDRVTPPTPKPRIARQEPEADADPAPLDDAAFDAGFQCPQSYDNAESRMDEIARYFAWAKNRHPDWSFRKRLDVRYGLLRRHACTTTLANMASAARPPFGR